MTGLKEGEKETIYGPGDIEAHEGYVSISCSVLFYSILFYSPSSLPLLFSLLCYSFVSITQIDWLIFISFLLADTRMAAIMSSVSILL